MCCPACGKVHIRDPLLLLEPVAYVATAGFLKRLNVWCTINLWYENLRIRREFNCRKTDLDQESTPSTLVHYLIINITSYFNFLFFKWIYPKTDWPKIYIFENTPKMSYIIFLINAISKKKGHFICWTKQHWP